MDLRRMALRIATHLGAGAIGMACWWGLKSSGSATDSAGQQGAMAVAAPASASAEAMVATRLEKVIAEEKKSQDRITKTTVRQAALESIARQKEETREHLEALQRWRAMADGFRSTENLSVPLQAALASEDEDLASAIFLEWHRRDPADALYQVCIRPSWAYVVFGNHPLMHAIPVREFTDFIATSCCPRYRDEIVQSIASHLGSMDDLAGLQAAYDALSKDEDQADYLLGRFIDEGWVPDDGPAAAAFITGKMSPALRGELIEILVNGVPNPHGALTDDFAKALLAQPLGDLEARRAEIEEEWGRIDNSLGDSFYFRQDDAKDRLGYLEGKEPEQEAMTRVVGKWLQHECDYPELFAAGEMDLDAIRAAVLKELPAAEAYPQVFDEALLRNLFAYRPEEAMSWAKGRIGTHRLGVAAGKVLDDLSEPRAARRQVILAALEEIPGSSTNEELQKLAEERKTMEEAVREWTEGWKNADDPKVAPEAEEDER